MAFQLVTFVVTLAANYVLSKLTAQDGPRLQNKEAASGEYGVPMPRVYGEKVRLTPAIVAQSDIDEDRHKLGGNSTLIGAGMGAATGFIYGGPVGAAIGGIAGGLFGSATQQYYYTYSVPALALFLADRTFQEPIEGSELKIWANGKPIFKSSESTVVDEEFDVDGVLIWRKWGKNKYLKGLRLYTGHTDQPVDDLLADEHEIAETSAHPFEAYCVLDDLQLAFSGNSVPQPETLFTVQVGETMASVAENICEQAGIDPLRDMSSTALTSATVRGLVLPSETNCWDALKPLLPAFGVDCADIAGQLRFYRRSQFMRSTIPLDDMGAHIYGDSPPEQFMFTRQTDLELPRELALTFSDPDRDYQSNTATASRTEGSAKSNVAASVNLVLAADEGASAAALMLWDSWLGRTGLSFALTDAWIGIAVGAAYGIPFADRVLPYRITRNLRGANGVHEVEAVSDESVTYTANVPGSSGNPPDDPSTLFPETRPVLMDMPIVSDDHDEYGFYVAMGATEPDWTRGRIEATANGTVWASIADGPTEATVGDVVGTLAAGSTTGLDDTLDTTTVLTVTLLHDGLSLVSATDAELDGWRNFAFVGKDGLGEYLQFKTATFISGTTWQLTNLRRGRKGTDFAIGTHASGEEFVLLDDGAGIFRVIYSSPDEWGDTLQVRGVTLHQDEADADILSFTNTGEGKRPYSPVNVEGTWDGSYNLTATFDARSRLNAGGLGIDDNFEFDVEITNATPVRAFTITTETFDYLAADAVSDGLIAGQVVEGRIRQTSDVNDGRWREFTLYGPLARTADSTLILADTTLLTADAG